MTPKQKKAYRAAARAINDLAKATLDDWEAYNSAIELVARSAGVMVGSATTAHDLSQDDLVEAANRVGRHCQTHAAETYAECIAKISARGERLQ